MSPTPTSSTPKTGAPNHVIDSRLLTDCSFALLQAV
jgi:hypothetical protein